MQFKGKIYIYIYLHIFLLLKNFPKTKTKKEIFEVFTYIYMIMT